MRQYPRLKKTSDEGKSQKENIMEKTTLKKIIEAVRDLEIKNCYFIYAYENEHELYLDTANDREAIILDDYVKYIESHLTKKTITKKFSIDDFKNFINWDIKTPKQEAQDNTTTEAELNASKSKIKLTINQGNYKYMYTRQD
jgi:hypothetical protein